VVGGSRTAPTVIVANANVNVIGIMHVAGGSRTAPTVIVANANVNVIGIMHVVGGSRIAPTVIVANANVNVIGYYACGGRFTNRLYGHCRQRIHPKWHTAPPGS